MILKRDYDLEDAFAAIEDELIDSMMRNMKLHRMEEIGEDKQWEMWQALQLKSLEEYKKKNQGKFTSWFSDINAQVDEVIRQANQMGKMEQEIEILNAIKNGFKGVKKVASTMQAEFFKLNERKLEALIKATTDDLEKAEHAILRRANDQYRKAIFNAQVYANSGASTYEKAVDMATKDMLSAGLNCVEYANGARHTLKDYADMAIRTASKRAYLQGEGVVRQSWGISMVIINKRGNPCPKCLPFCGKVLIDDVWSGGKASDGPYPLMSTAIVAGLYHPRCKDSHTTYFEGISTPPDNKYTQIDIQQIMDNYQEEQKKQYAKRQAEKYERLAEHSLDKENRKQYGARAKEWNGEYNKGNSFVYEDKPVYFDESNDYSVRFDEFNEKVNHGLSDALKDVAKKGNADRCEHMYLVNLKTGKLEYYETNGERNKVGIDFWKYVEEHSDAEYAFIHNHNIISSLSESDLITPIVYKNIPLQIATQNDGVKYIAKRTKPYIKGFYPDFYYEKELKELNMRSRSGKITPTEREAERERIIIQCMLDEFYEGGVITLDGRTNK